MDPVSVVVGAGAIWLAAIVSPGPNFLVVSRLALSRSGRTAVGATFGIAIGSVFYAALAMFGLGAVVARLGWFGQAVRVAGGAYLVWLGVQAWREAPRGSREVEAPTTVHRPSLVRGARVGLVSELSNPKGIAFFLGLFTAAVPVATPLWAKLTLLGIGGCLEVAWYLLVAVALASGPIQALRGRARRGIDRAVGAVLIALGLKVAWEAA